MTKLNVVGNFIKEGVCSEVSLAPPAAPRGDDASLGYFSGWVELVDRIQSGEIDGMKALYGLFSKGLRFHLSRQLATQELDDKVHDTFVIVVECIRRGELREPERLMGFVRTVARRQVAAHIDGVVHTRRRESVFGFDKVVADPHRNPEEAAILHERAELLDRVLSELEDRDREILTRFYLNEQGQDQICSEMALTETQFRLLKSRAKARFGELGKKMLAPHHLGLVCRRFSAGHSL